MPIGSVSWKLYSENNAQVKFEAHIDEIENDSSKALFSPLNLRGPPTATLRNFQKISSEPPLRRKHLHEDRILTYCQDFLYTETSILDDNFTSVAKPTATLRNFQKISSEPPLRRKHLHEDRILRYCQDFLYTETSILDDNFTSVAKFLSYLFWCWCWCSFKALETMHK
ncbi:hypothetical protein QE152_g6378 [Popillia japonica]|uniref:Uncharacterized protein n=1 Tax=Popillia japonica TaxID=7064 RepID=A0AAW1MFH3_POPJA